MRHLEQSLLSLSVAFCSAKLSNAGSSSIISLRVEVMYTTHASLLLLNLPFEISLLKTWNMRDDGRKITCFDKGGIFIGTCR